MSIVRWLISFIFWLQAFAAPFLLFGLIALLVYSKGEQNKNPAIILLVAGAVAGIIVAEYIRRKIGLDTFFGRIYGGEDNKQ